MLLVLDRSVFELDLRNRDQLEWFGDRHGGNLGPDLFGEADALLDRFGSEIRPVSRDQNIPEQYAAPPASAPFWRLVGSWSRLVIALPEPLNG